MDLRSEIARYAETRNKKPPRHLGQRYDTSGFLPEAGNTVVCALNTADPAHRAILTAREQVRGLPGADKLLFTPASSLHMTVFEGVIETRRMPDAWPADMDPDASIDAVTRALIPRLSDFHAPPEFAVRAVGIGPGGLILAGACAEDDAHLVAWRAALTVPFGYRQQGHESYRFHMTFGYPLRWLSADELPEWNAGLASIFAELTDAAPVIPLCRPAFCQFADMTHFEEQLVLA